MKTWLDNKIILFLVAVVDVIWISLLWYLSSILIVTMGAAGTAMYYTVHKRIFNGEGYIFQTYKRSFLDNFKKATTLWLICLLIDVFFVFDAYLSRVALKTGSALSVLYYPFLICIVFALMWQLAITAYQARFDDSIKIILIKGAYLAARNIGWMLFLVLVLAGGVYLCRYLMFLSVILPGAFACLMHHVFEHIFKKNGWIERE